MEMYVKAKIVSLKNHLEFTEKWVQARIAEDPSIIGLGELSLKDSERPQPSGGRLDLLLHDPDSNTRYEVELQLGKSDESHIIRTIEYWDYQRKKFPQYKHCAVLIAEDITSRFFKCYCPLQRQHSAHRNSDESNQSRWHRNAFIHHCS